MHNHAPILVSIKSGKIKTIDLENKTSFVEIAGETIKVKGNIIDIPADVGLKE